MVEYVRSTLTSPTPTDAAFEFSIRPASTAEIDSIWRARWGLPVVTLSGRYLPSDVRGLVAADATDEVVGLVTWVVDGDAAEIVSLDALAQGRGVGTALLSRAEGEARGAARVWLQTSNDNLRALCFYALRGYRLVAVHLDAMDVVRQAKPEVPERGLDGIPLRDAWVMEKRIPPP